MFQNIGWKEVLIVVAVLLILFGGKYLFKRGKKTDDSVKETPEVTQEN